MLTCAGINKAHDGSWTLGEPKSRAGRRDLPLAPDTLAVLEAHRKEERRWSSVLTPDRPVFATASGTHFDHHNVRRTLKQFQGLAKVPRIRFHDLRHTAASLLIRQGVPPKLVSDRLGHADVAFTLKVYTHLDDEQRRDAALPLDRLLATGPASVPSAVPSASLATNGDVLAVLEECRDLLREVRDALRKR